MRLNKKILALGAAALLVLTGCEKEDIVAKPTNYEDVLIEGVSDDVVRNIEKVVIDKLQTSTTNEILNEVLFLLAEAKFGKWEEVKVDVEKAAFTAQVEERLARKMLGKANLSSFKKRNHFSEYDFAMSLVKQFYKINGTYDLDTLPQDAWHENVVITPDVTWENVYDRVLNKAYYEDYMVAQLVPEVYRELLTEDYLINNDYRSLYLARARKVNYISLTINENFPADAKYLLYEFIDQNILGTDPSKPADLEILANAWRGDQSVWTHNEEALLQAAGLIGDKSTDDPSTEYVEYSFDHTAFGNVLADYAKIKDNPLTTDTAVEQAFTNSGKYPKEIGLEIKTNEVRILDYTVDGWYIQYDGLKTLPETIRTRLFSSKVEKAVDYVLDDLGDAENGGYTETGENKDATRSSYIRNINGKFYLMPETYDEDDDRNFIHYDSGSKTYYLIEVEEAVNRTKFDADNEDNNYVGLGKDLDEIVAGVAKVVGGRSDKRSEATEYVIKNADLKFHDQAVYDFFVKQFPDLFGKMQRINSHKML